MIRIWLSFFFIALIVHFGIQAWRDMTGKERWSLTKSLGYSIIVALLAVLVMTVFVVLF
jgi:hypothetical protein